MNGKYARAAAQVTAWAALACASAGGQSGRVEHGQITSEALAGNLLGDSATRSFSVYLPPSYDSAAKRYPAIYVLHGYTQNERGLVFPVQFQLETLITSRRLNELIAVFVNATNRLGGSFYLNSPVIGDYETYITKDLVSRIDRQYRTLVARESRGITGFSMGGWGAMHLALKFPSVFSVAVPVAGFYDSQSPWAMGASKQLVTAAPQSPSELAGIPWPASGFQALFAGLLPNATKPPFFADYPFEVRNGEFSGIEEAQARCRSGDVQNGDLGRYLQQPIRLNGIKVVHGASDALVPVSEARQLTNAFAQAGVMFEYEEFAGEHAYPAEQALPFLSSHLQGGERYIIRPRVRILPDIDGSVRLMFAAQAGVIYIVESKTGEKGSDWEEKARVIGNEQTATCVFAVKDRAQLFRVRAANLE